METQNNLFTPISNRRTFEQVSNEIKKVIFTGVLKPGDKLPSEVAMARQFKVGRQTVREGLRLLELSGFIAIQKGSTGGPVIKDTIHHKIGNLFLDAIQLKKMTGEELTIARLEIEKIILKYVIKNIQGDEINDIKENIYKAKEMVNQGIPAFEKNVEFHKLLAKATKNSVFNIVMESLMVVVCHFLSGLETDLERSNRVLRYHDVILDAIIKKDEEKAINTLEEHLLEVRSRL
jgi:DNA-binding FadR family transcriptional regulator